MTWEEIRPQEWKEEKEGDFIEGVLVNTQDKVGMHESMVYSIDTSEGVKKVWGSAILDSLMGYVKLGSRLRITYEGLGEAKGGKNPPKIFKVEVDREDEVETQKIG